MLVWEGCVWEGWCQCGRGDVSVGGVVLVCGRGGVWEGWCQCGGVVLVWEGWC